MVNQPPAALDPSASGSPEIPEDAPRPPGAFDALIHPMLALFVVGFGVWLVFAWTRYGKDVAQAGPGWRLGGTHLVDLSLTREDIDARACASDVVIDGLHCGSPADRGQGPTDGAPSPDQNPNLILRPYVTVRGETFLGAGLWNAPDLTQPLPDRTFHVVCNLHIVGVARSVAMRWKANARFAAAKSTLAVGSLTDCLIPR